MSEMKETEAKRPIMPDAGADNRPLVELTHVEKHYGDLHVLKDINLTVRKGEVLVIVGPSGSGKSTMCRTINRLETIDSGDIRIDGKPLPQEGKELAKLRTEEQAADMARQILQSTVSGGFTTPAVLTTTLANWVGEERSFSLLRLDEADLTTPLPAATDADLNAY